MADEIAAALNAASERKKVLTERIDNLRTAIMHAGKQTHETFTAVALGDALLADTKALAAAKQTGEGK